MPRRGPVLTVIITATNEGLDKGLKEAEAKIGAFGGRAGKLGKAAKVAAPIVGVTAAAAKLGSAADKTATDIASFNAAMEKAGLSADEMATLIKPAIQGSKDLAFSSGATRDALMALQTATGDAATSVDLLGTAQNVARLAGVDLEVAADAVAKAYAGQDRALRALIPGLPVAATGMESIANAEALAAGQADIFAGSAEAMGIKTKNALKGLAVAIGTAVQPAFKSLLAALLPLVESLSELVVAILPVLVPLITAVAKAFEVAAKAISKVVSIVAQLINKIRELLAPLREAANLIQKVIPGGNAVAGIVGGTASVATVAGLTATPTPTAARGGTGGVTINIYGDPAVIEARVTRALRDYARHNGRGSVFTPERV